MNFLPQKTSEKDLAELEDVFLKLKIVEMEPALHELESFFKSAPTNIDKTNRWNYFRWFTSLSWQFMMQQLPSFVVETMFGRQVVMAILLGIDVQKEFFHYCALKPFDEDTISVFYARVKAAFLESKAFVGVWQGKDIFLKDIIADVRILNQPNSDSIRNAEILTKITSILFPKNDSRFNSFVVIKADTAVDRLVGLINFFLGIKPDTIWYMVDSYFNPIKYEALAAKAENNVAGGMRAALPSSTVEVTEQEIETVPEPLPKPTHAEIKTMIEARFAKSVDGQFVNIEGVLSLLDALADEYSDESIRELYFFNESAGAFQWNDTLIAS